MNITLRRYTEDQRELWDDFVTHSTNGTFLHTRPFYDHNTLNAADDCSFLFLKNEKKVVGVFPCNLYMKNGEKTMHSYLRSTYGGFVVGTEAGASDVIEMVRLIKQEAVLLNVHEIIVRNSFRIFHALLSDDSDYAMWFHGFKIKSRELETAVRLGNYQTAQSLYSDSTRRSIKKSYAHVTVSESSDLEGFWTMLEDNLAARHGIKPTHSLEQFRMLIRNVGSEKIKLFSACHNSKMIAGIVLFLVNDRALHAQYIASDNAFQEYRPLNAVIDTIIKWGCDNYYDYLNLGTSNYDAGMGINEGLFRFKEGFGGRNTLRETMHLILREK